MSQITVDGVNLNFKESAFTGDQWESVASFVLNGGGEDFDGTGLPAVTTEDNGKVLGVVNGVWAPTEQTGGSGGTDLPTVTEVDDGKILQVVGGTWAAVAITDGNTVAY